MKVEIPQISEREIQAKFAEIEPALGKLMMPAELTLKAEVICQIDALKAERNAVILGHNYMEAALFHAADLKGDSLELCRLAAKTTAEVLVFCGVEFMAETAKVLCPDKTVLLPAKKAGCSLAQSITAADVRALRERYPGVPVVTYINTYADVKAETDICCTSGNAIQIVESLDSDTVIFIPDEFLARNVAKATGKHLIVPKIMADRSDTVVEQTMIAWHGTCEVHEQFQVSDITNARREAPGVLVLAHPECRPEVVDAADFSGSTSAMIRYVREHPGARYLLLTECAMADNVIAETKDSEILRMCSIRCPHMAQITLEDTRDALSFFRYEIQVPEAIRLRAKQSIDRMLALS